MVEVVYAVAFGLITFMTGYYICDRKFTNYIFNKNISGVREEITILKENERLRKELLEQIDTIQKKYSLAQYKGVQNS